MSEFGPGREVFLEPEGRPLQNEDELPFRLLREREEAENETGTEIKEFIKRLDFDLLRNIHAGEYERAGGDPSQMNFVGPEHIYSKAGFSNRGAYKAGSNVIGIDAWSTAKDARKHGLNPDLLLLHTFVHEESHAVQRVDCHIGKIENDDYANDGYIRQVRGDEKDSGKVRILKKLFEDFGEGVTDKMALEMSERYAVQKRFGSDAEVQALKDYLRTKGQYAWNQHVVDAFIQKLSHVAELPSVVVWEAVKAGALRGG